MKNDSTKLRTAAQIAERRLFERRMDPAAYRTEKHGTAWIAYSPHGEIYQYKLGTPTDGTVVLCCSSSGMIYRLVQDPGGDAFSCSCPAQAKAPDAACKHGIGLRACIMAGRMARELGGAK